MRILLADDHVMLRDGLRPFLLDLADTVDVLEAGSFGETLEILAGVPDVGLLLIDLRMPGMEVPAGLKLLRDRHPSLPMAILSSVTDRKVILDAMTLGVAGFIPKRLSAQAMVSALRLIISGERYVPSTLLADAARPGVGPGMELEGAERTLTTREREILDLLREGLPNKLIARRLNVSEVTVKSHLCHVFRKLGVQNRVQAARYTDGVD